MISGQVLLIVVVVGGSIWLGGKAVKAVDHGVKKMAHALHLTHTPKPPTTPVKDTK